MAGGKFFRAIEAHHDPGIPIGFYVTAGPLRAAVSGGLFPYLFVLSFRMVTVMKKRRSGTT